MEWVVRGVGGSRGLWWVRWWWVRSVVGEVVVGQIGGG
ncbi:hypothetical protein SERN_2280 [Serinibacter arcticus]|uniref:Uncharacterized protein n=1 Tax=Serinibacter arcticus TaxID=1655435 RepID=A0A4Z1E4M3_9MICO|nr:hypothetical protein SERN_2280 [Serinibacter arcticus]